MLKRKIEKVLDNFKAGARALFIKGALLIGKTFSISEWGRRNYSSFIRISFLEHPEAVSLFTGSYQAERIYSALSLFTDEPLIEGDTLIFFDDAEWCPEIIGAVKYLVEDGKFRYILSGILTDVEFSAMRSIPLGYLDVKEMYPLDFEEFLWAMGEKDESIEYARKAFNRGVSPDADLNDRLSEFFSLYMEVGGMPSAVSDFVRSGNIEDAGKEHDSLLLKVEEYLSYYEKKHGISISSACDESTLEWLRDSGFALPSFFVNKTAYPLERYVVKNDFRPHPFYAGDALSFAAAELSAHGFRLYHSEEYDFIVEKGQHVLSISVFPESNEFILHSEESEVSLPLYLLSFLEKDSGEDFFYEPDLSALR